jgi:hypothetical protein
MKLTPSILSMFLAALVLMASSNFYVGMHRCGGAVKAIAFLDKADACGHKVPPPCHRHTKKSCCEDEQIVHHGLDFKSGEPTSIVPAFYSTEILYTSVVLALIIPDFTDNPSWYFSYHPPAVSSDDIIISIHSLLI